MKCFRCGNPISGFECEKCGYTYLMEPLSTFSPLESGQITAINSTIQSALPQGARYVCVPAAVDNPHLQISPHSLGFITHYRISFPRLYSYRDDDEGLSWYKTRAANNDPIAQNNLGVYYLLRLDSGSKKAPRASEIREAETLLRKSADAGNPVAMYNVSVYLDMQLQYHEHLSVIQKIKNAISPDLFPAPTSRVEKVAECNAMVKKSAEAGFRHAIDILAAFYQFGAYGNPRDSSKCIELYTQSAGLGSMTAVRELADIYYWLATNSKDPTKYIQEALSYYIIYLNYWRYAADVNTEKLNYAKLLMAPQIKRYQEAADILQTIDIEKCYDKKIVHRVSVMLAELYFNGLGVEQDPSEAYRYYRIAERYGDKEAGSIANNIAAHADKY